MCILYSYLLQLTSDLGNGVCDQFALNGVVCPPKIHSGVAVDNVDYNPVLLQQDSLISLMQHPSHEFEGSNFYIH